MRAVTTVSGSGGFRGLDGRAVLSAGFALFAVLVADWWIVSSVAAVGAVLFAVLAWRAQRVDRALRGAALTLVGFVVGAGVLVFAIIGPRVWTSVAGAFVFGAV